ncbi:hypothetical protein BGW80DRAFT_917658 [Lactifluus volemus]|nr:hypothetical protein BGW80DRAFT_917658 [Lactifluus volemus]
MHCICTPQYTLSLRRHTYILYSTPRSPRYSLHLYFICCITRTFFPLLSSRSRFVHRSFLFSLVLILSYLFSPFILYLPLRSCFVDRFDLCSLFFFSPLATCSAVAIIWNIGKADIQSLEWSSLVKFFFDGACWRSRTRGSKPTLLLFSLRDFRQRHAQHGC